MHFFDIRLGFGPGDPDGIPLSGAHSSHRSLTERDRSPKPYETPRVPLRRSRRLAPYIHPARSRQGPAAVRDLRAKADLADATADLGDPLAAARTCFAPELLEEITNA